MLKIQRCQFEVQRCMFEVGGGTSEVLWGVVEVGSNKLNLEIATSALEILLAERVDSPPRNDAPLNHPLNISLKVVPFPSSDLTWILPLCRRIICLDRLRPIPEPFFLVVKKGIKIFDKASSSIPFPVSDTSRIIFPLSSIKALNWISFCSLFSTECTAFWVRLITTCSIRLQSAKSSRSAGTIFLEREISLALNWLSKSFST